MSWVKRGMVDMIEKRGAVSVFLLSCWPNALFDLCGIICGHYMMPFWSFFVALCLGKGIIKVAIQTSLFVFLFSDRFDRARAHLIGVVGQMPPWSTLINRRFGDSESFERYVYDKITLLRHGLGNAREKKTLASRCFSLLLLVLISYFVIAAVNQFAQMRQKEVDDREIKLMIQREQIKSNGGNE